jgi:hypothetical protein
MSTTRPSNLQSQSDDGIDHASIAEYDERGQLVAAYLREHSDIRIALARHKERGGWFVLITHVDGRGPVSGDVPKDSTPAELMAMVDLLHGRLDFVKTKKDKIVRLGGGSGLLSRTVKPGQYAAAVTPSPAKDKDEFAFATSVADAVEDSDEFDW